MGEREHLLSSALFELSSDFGVLPNGTKLAE